MTSDQYARWKDFAMRMSAVLQSRRPSKKWIRERIEFFFEVYMTEKEAAGVVTWDDTEMSYAKGDLTEHVADVTQPGFLRLDEESKRYEDSRARWRERWVSPLICCIRAGLDVASKPSGGVVGFTVGDLRRMYPEGIPDWVAKPDPPFKDDDGQPIDLRTRPDEESVWL